MRSVFTVELGGKTDLYCELDLPATPYQLLEAFGEKGNWDVFPLATIPEPDYTENLLPGQVQDDAAHQQSDIPFQGMGMS